MATIKFNKLHGDSSWKQVLEKEDWNRAIFFGNYLDGSHHTNEELAQNLSDIIDAARRDSRMILLLGEHDRQYVGGPKVPGYREDGHELFEKVLMSGHDVFLRSLLSGILDDDSQMSEGFYYLNDEPRPLREETTAVQKKEDKEYEYEIVDGRKIGIYSSYGSNIDQSVIDSQARVFQTFDRKINQVSWDGRHPAFLDHITRTEEVDFFVFFDIDAVPLRPDFLEEMIERAGEDSILGAEQVSVHISDHLFAASFAFCISRKLYERMGRPSFEITDRSDCAQELTHLAQEMGIRVDLIKFSECKKEHYYWKLPDGRKYGYGSRYEDLIYHNFESRHSAFRNFFLEECKEITKTFRSFPV